MKERPILFNGAMVRAILSGAKTQTRRVAKPKRSMEPMSDECPYGQPGDRMWVRETWTNAWDELKNHWSDPERYHYRADGIEVAHVDGMERSPWIPSIHMPRRACRLVLEITAVRVERLQAISEADAIAEGATAWAGEQNTPIRDLDTGDERIAFMAMWNCAGGDWDSNPWVWVIEFKRVEA